MEADLRGKCPYGQPPRVEKTSEADWFINGVPRDLKNPECTWIAANADACAGCEFNRENQPAASPFVQYLFWLDNLKSVGATFRFEDEPMRVWEGLIVLASERERAFKKSMKEK